MELLQMDSSYAERDLNVGFSGGEKKKTEILQMLMLRPELAILDETDSGLDVDAVRTVSKGVEEYQKTRDGALLIITHSTRILEALHVDYTHVLVDGHIVKTGDASLIDEINEHGFEKYLDLFKTGIRDGEVSWMKEKTYVDDVDRSIYDIRNEEKDVYRVQEGLDASIVEKKNIKRKRTILPG